MRIFGYSIGQIRKGLVATAGIIAELVSLNLLHGDVAHWASWTAGVLTVVGTFAIRNDPVPDDPAPGRH